MPPAWKLSLLPLAIYLITAGIALPGGAGPLNSHLGQASANDQNQDQDQASKPEAPDSQDEAVEEESEPAAVQLDVSNVSPLIRELYQRLARPRSQRFWPTWRRRKHFLEAAPT